MALSVIRNSPLQRITFPRAAARTCLLGCRPNLPGAPRPGPPAGSKLPAPGFLQLETYSGKYNFIALPKKQWIVSDPLFFLFILLLHYTYNFYIILIW